MNDNLIEINFDDGERPRKAYFNKVQYGIAETIANTFMTSRITFNEKEPRVIIVEVFDGEKTYQVKVPPANGMFDSYTDLTTGIGVPGVLQEFIGKMDIDITNEAGKPMSVVGSVILARCLLVLELIADKFGLTHMEGMRAVIGRETYLRYVMPDDMRNFMDRIIFNESLEANGMIVFINSRTNEKLFYINVRNLT